jgi:hypothetical protein
MKTTTMQRLVNTLSYLTTKNERQQKFINTWEPLSEKLAKTYSEGSEQDVFDSLSDAIDFIRDRITTVRKANEETTTRINAIKEALKALPVN